MNIPRGLSVIQNTQLKWQHIDRIDSTNNYLLDTQQPANQVISANKQTAGRGRHQQQWLDQGQSALFSLSTDFSPNRDISAWSIQVAIILAKTLNQLYQHFGKSRTAPVENPLIKVKWPNDLYTLNHDKVWGKCCGILIESQISKNYGKIVTGIGLNLSEVPIANSEYPSAFVDLPIDKQTLITILGNQLFNAWQAFLTQPCVDPMTYQQFDWLADKTVSATDLYLGTTQTGIAMGISPQGHLCLDVDGQTTVLTTQQRIRVLS